MVWLLFFVSLSQVGLELTRMDVSCPSSWEVEEERELSVDKSELEYSLQTKLLKHKCSKSDG